MYTAPYGENFPPVLRCMMDSGREAGELALPGGIASPGGACQDGVHARNSI